MGSPAQEQGRDLNDQPQHAMRIGRAFAIANKKVTVRQFKEFWRSRYKQAGENPAVSVYSPNDDGPILGVTWYQAAEYCNWLSAQEGIPEDEWCYEKVKEGIVLPQGHLSRTGYRLPTQAEWEYACRAGTITRRPHGSADELLAKYAWFRDNSENLARPVGLLKPNDIGVFDALGNTWDWCQDRSHDSEKSKPPAEDQEEAGPVSPKQQRVTRGGSFGNPAGEIRSASRSLPTPDYLGDPIGIRVARTIR
jgi:formylglycine-generating enzyme required for sulfatase activity